MGDSFMPSPAAISRRETFSVVERGLSLSAHLASTSPIGATRRSCRPSWGVPDGSSILPQVAARRTDTYRWREGAVTISPIRNAAPARQKTARTE